MKRFITIVLLLASTAFAQEDKLIATLKSDAPLKEKSDACRELTVIGTAKAVPALAPLLLDEKLSHMARYALEPIADPSVDIALRSALGKLKGQMLVGVIDSIGVRKDAKALEPLAKLLADTDPAVARAAARTLGKFGGPAAQTLKNALPGNSLAIRLALCEGLLRCAETMPNADATAIYDRIRPLPNLPRQVRLAALRGAILSRGPEGADMLIGIIRAESGPSLTDAMGISMQMPGRKLTVAMTKELPKAYLQKRLVLLKTLGYRADPAATPAIVPLARTGPAPQRIAAIRSLAQLGASSSIPVLTALVKDAEPTVASAAQDALVGFPNKRADKAVVKLLSDSNPKTRLAAADMIRRRRIATAVKPLLKAARDTNADVVTAAFKTLGELATAADIPAVTDAILKTDSVAPAEAALSAICARQSDKALCTDKLLPALKNAKGKSKLALIRVLGTLGNPQALTAVRRAAAESEKEVAETALRAICDWPTPHALPDLAKIAKTTKDKTLKILALRGQLRLIPMQTVPDAKKLSQLKETLPLIERTEEHRLVLAILGQIPTAESLALATTYLPREELKEEASTAAVTIAEKIVATHPAQVAEAMKQVRTTNKELADRARKLLAGVPK